MTNKCEQTRPLNVVKGRDADYTLLEIVQQFAPSDRDMAGTSANIKKSLEPYDSVEYEDTFGNNVAAPYVLARLCALFNDLKIDVSGQEGYKVTWSVCLEHKSTGHLATFYDYKGGVSYGSDTYGDNAPEDFVRDFKKLLQTLASNRCPHPYDGCVVGEIA